MWAQSLLGDAAICARPSEASPEGEAEGRDSENLRHAQGPGSEVDAEVTEPPDSAERFPDG